MKARVTVFTTCVAICLLVAADEPKSGTQTSDEKAIRSLLAQLEKDWNVHDMKNFSTRLADDVDVVNRYGQWMKGRPAVTKHLIGLHASPFRDQLASRSSKVEEVRFLTPEIAVAHEVTEELIGKSVRTYLLQKQGGAWLIESATIIEQKAPPAG